MRSSKTSKLQLTSFDFDSKGCSIRASLIGVCVLLFAVSNLNIPINSAPISESSATADLMQTSQNSTSDELRRAAIEYCDACNFENARTKLDEDLALNQNHDKNRLPETYLLLGNTYRLEGMFGEAKTWTVRGLSSLEKMKPRDAKRLTSAYNYLALLNNNAGEFSDSEKNARKAIALSNEAGLGQENEAMHKVVLANALRQQGKYEEALKELTAAISVLKNNGDKKLFATATNNLGALYFWMGDYQRALPIVQDGLKQRLSLFGETHPDVANSYLDLGCIEFKQGDFESAIEHLTDAHEIRLTKLGANHPETLSAEANLAVILLTTGDSTKAVELLKHAVEVGRNVLGNKNPDLAQYADDYANALAASKQFDEARNILSESLAVRKSVFGAGSREYASGLRSLAQIELSAGNRKASHQLINKSINIYLVLNRRPDLDYAEALDELANVYVESNQLNAARQTFALAVREKFKSGNSLSYAISLANLSELLHRMKNDAESVVMLRKAAATIETLPEGQRNNPDCKVILERLSKLQIK